MGLNLFEKVLQRHLITGITSEHFIGEGNTFWRDNQSDDHLHAITSLVSTVPELALV
jgi:hypothetical protein